jgi:hypothetical protein
MASYLQQKGNDTPPQRVWQGASNFVLKKHIACSTYVPSYAVRMYFLRRMPCFATTGMVPRN